MFQTVLLPILVGAVAGVLGSLATMILTPRLQHHFWKLQRLADLQFETIRELNTLMAEYLAGHISKDTGQDPSWRPSRDFFISLRASMTQLSVLFSKKVWDTFKRVEEMLTADGGLGMPHQSLTEQHFIRAHDQAVRVSYEEMGLKLAPYSPKE